MTARTHRTLAPLALVAPLLVGGCTGAAHVAAPPRVVAPRPVPPDLHGEPLALLPPRPLLWLRVDAAEARASQHWPTVSAMLAQNAGDALRTLERELGFDPLQQADMLALGMYARPGAPSGSEAHPWPIFLARGRIDASAILAAARARAAADDPLTERSEGGLRVYATRVRAYAFPAPDVVLVFDPALTRRVARQLSGEERESALHDGRFDALWEQAGGRGGSVQLAADGAQIRASGGEEAEDPLARSIDQSVLRLEAPGEVRASVIALAVDEPSAQRLVATVDETRGSLLRNFAVRMLGLQRLLQQGLTAVHEGRLVRVRVEARADEASRVLRAAQVLQVAMPAASD